MDCGCGRGWLAVAVFLIFSFQHSHAAFRAFARGAARNPASQLGSDSRPE
jgi:hypothetical protein